MGVQHKKTGTLLLGVNPHLLNLRTRGGHAERALSWKQPRGAQKVIRE